MQSLPSGDGPAIPKPIGKEETREMTQNSSPTLPFLGVILAVLVCAFAHAQVSQLEPRVDAVFASVDKKDSPGCAIAVVERGKLIYKRGYGMANLDYNIPITPESNFYI